MNGKIELDRKGNRGRENRAFSRNITIKEINFTRNYGKTEEVSNNDIAEQGTMQQFQMVLSDK